MEAGHSEVGATMEKALLCLRVMRKLTVNGFKVPHQSNFVMEFVSTLYERVKHLLQYRTANYFRTLERTIKKEGIFLPDRSIGSL